MTDIFLRYSVIAGITIGLLLVAAALYIYHKARQKNSSLMLNYQSSQSRKDELVKYENEVKKLIEKIQTEKNSFEKEKLLAETESYKKYAICGQPVVDAIIAYKQKYCEEHNISLKLKISSLPDMGFTDEEYVGIFGNLLDNAIDAAIKTEMPEIKLKSFTAGNQWILEIVNTKPEIQHPIDTNFITTKDDPENHGLGSKIIRKIVRKHKGAIDFSDEGDYFKVMIVFPVILNKE